jgi:hypothetical protein
VRIWIERIVIAGLPEAPALDDFAGELRGELTRAFAGATQAASREVGEVHAELPREGVSAHAIAAAARAAVGGPE